MQEKNILRQLSFPSPIKRDKYGRPCCFRGYNQGEEREKESFWPWSPRPSEREMEEIVKQAGMDGDAEF